MQKLDFLATLRTVVTELKCDAVRTLLDADLNDIRASPNQAWPRNQHYLPLLLDAKSNYDRLKTLPVALEILTSVEAGRVFETVAFARILDVIVPGKQVIQAYHSEPMILVQVFYRVLHDLGQLSSKLLISEPALLTMNSEEAGIIVFQVADRAENEEISNYVKIFSALAEFFEMLGQTVAAAQPQTAALGGARARVVMLDSGSSSSIGIKTTIEVAKLAFEVFKEVWDYVVNRGHYQNKRANESLLENLKALQAVKEAGKNGLLTPEKCDQYSALLIRKTDELIGLNVLPKRIADEVRREPNGALLQWLNQPKQIDLGLSPPSAADDATGGGQPDP